MASTVCVGLIWCFGLGGAFWFALWVVLAGVLGFLAFCFWGCSDLGSRCGFVFGCFSCACWVVFGASFAGDVAVVLGGIFWCDCGGLGRWGWFIVWFWVFVPLVSLVVVCLPFWVPWMVGGG